jgi:DNA-binding transcriptional LysR family regulator
MELRHLRYFTAVVRHNGYREASRQLNITQPAISQTVADLERELGLRLFFRAGRTAKLTPQGEVFYPEAIRTLDQADSAIAIVKRAAKDDMERLSIGYWGPATYEFLPELVRDFKALCPKIKLNLQELTPLQQEIAFDQSLIDIGLTNTSEAELDKTFSSRCLYSDPLLAVLPVSRSIPSKYLRTADLADQRFVLFDRKGAPVLFATIVRMCSRFGFSPNVISEPNSMQTVVSLVEAEEGVAIVPACVRNFGSPSVCFYRLDPDDARTELRAVWRRDAVSVALQSFLELVEDKIPHIRRKAAFSENSLGRASFIPRSNHMMPVEFMS